jgi:hypothetical protein
VDTNELRVTTTEVAGPQLQRLQGAAFGILVLGLVLSALGVMLNPQGPQGKGWWPGFLQSYLFAYIFWTGLCLGSLGFIMVHNMVGGGWGFVIRRLLEAAGSPVTLGVMAVLFLPIALSLWAPTPALYVWARPEAAPEPLRHIIATKDDYLNPPFFIVRAVLYFLIWISLAAAFRRWSTILDEREDARVYRLTNLWGGLGIVIYVLSVTFAWVDWVMSLSPDWLSSIFGLLTVVSQGLSTLAMMLLLVWILGGDKPLVRGLPSKFFRDLGNLTLAFVLLWAYMAFSQYLIQYSGNIAEEVSWQLDRSQHGWGWVCRALVIFHFALPFLVLLIWSGLKRNPRLMGRLAVAILLIHLVYDFWLVTPTFRPQISVNLADLGAPLLIGGIWLLAWITQFKDRPVVPLHDPRLVTHLEEVVDHA